MRVRLQQQRRLFRRFYPGTFGEFYGRWSAHYLNLVVPNHSKRMDQIQNQQKILEDFNLSPAMIERENIRVELQESDLWNKFHEKTNEMIVTKNGRRMFPVIKANISGLEPNTFYSVILEFKQIEKNRWKYINGEWLAGNIK